MAGPVSHGWGTAEALRERGSSRATADTEGRVLTADEHFRQREAVRLSLTLADTRSDRRDGPRRKPVTVAVVTQHAKASAGAHVYVIPVVTERLL